MLRLSSNITLFLKLFVPTAWVSFFGLFTLVIFLVDTTDKPLLASSTFKITFLTMFALFMVLIYFTIFQLKRVEIEERYFFVTNYFKTIKFSLESVKHISVLNLGIVKLATIQLHQKGIFGKRISFIAKSSNFNNFKETYKDIQFV